jgi:hypothetical protein
MASAFTVTLQKRLHLSLVSYRRLHMTALSDSIPRKGREEEQSKKKSLGPQFRVDKQVTSAPVLSVTFIFNHYSQVIRCFKNFIWNELAAISIPRTKFEATLDRICFSTGKYL